MLSSTPKLYDSKMCYPLAAKAIITFHFYIREGSGQAQSFLGLFCHFDRPGTVRERREVTKVVLLLLGCFLFT